MKWPFTPEPHDPRWKTADAQSAEKPDPSVVLEEHRGQKPKAYMVFGNLKNIQADVEEILSLLNDEDDPPAWVQEAIAGAKGAVSRALHYIRARKTPPSQDG